MTTTETKKPAYVNRSDIGIYKANNKKTGSVAQFKMGGKNDCMFLELAKQVRPMDDSAPYDWKGTKICVKLGQTDITKMMAYFAPQLLYYRQAPQPLKLFHKTPTGSKTIELKWQEREYKGNKTYSYYLSVSAKQGSLDPQRIAIPISLDEVELLKVGFTRALEIILGW
jgi:hypothetical protein